MALRERPLSAGDLLKPSVQTSGARYVRISVRGTHPSSGDQLVVEPALWELTEATELPSGATIAAPGEYDVEILASRSGRPLLAFACSVADVEGGITLAEMYRAGSDPIDVDPGVIREGDPVTRLDLSGLPGSPGGSGSTAWGDITGKPATFPPSGHNHDDRYYTKTETTTAINTKAAAADLTAHVANASNPHAVTAAQAGALAIANDLSDLSSTSAARTNLGLGNAATKNVGTAAGTVAAGDHGHTLAQITDAGTAASRNAPASGDAGATEVVIGTDTRLSDSRSPSGAAGGILTGSFPNPGLNINGTQFSTSGNTLSIATAGVSTNQIAGGAVTDAKVVTVSASKITGTISDTQHGSRGGGNLHPAATTSAAGFMSAADKAALDALSATIPTKADLVGGVVPTAQLPAIAITDVYPVSSQAEMLALSAQRGDVAIRSDIPGTYILAGDDPSVLANWKPLPVPSDAVLSVNGQSGVVVLSYGDVGAAAADHNHVPEDITGLGTAALMDGPPEGEEANYIQVVRGDDPRLFNSRLPLEDSVGTTKLVDGAVTNDKLAAASKIGLLADLLTTEKGSIVGAINEVVGGGIGGAGAAWALLSHTLPKGTPGGTAQADAIRALPVNTIEYDAIGLSLDSGTGRATVPAAGTYLHIVVRSYFACDNTSTYIRRTSGTPAIVSFGLPTHAVNSIGGHSAGVALAIITQTESTVYETSYRPYTTVSGQGLGYPNQGLWDGAASECYEYWLICKIA